MLRPERELQCLKPARAPASLSPNPMAEAASQLIKRALFSSRERKWEGGNYKGETRGGWRNRHGKRQDIKNPEFWSTLYPTQLDNPRQATGSLGDSVSPSVN